MFAIVVSRYGWLERSHFCEECNPPRFCKNSEHAYRFWNQDVYLVIKQLQKEGYEGFIVNLLIPHCDLD